MTTFLSQLDIPPGLARRNPMGIRYESNGLGHRSPFLQQLDSQIGSLRDLIAPGSSHAAKILAQMPFLLPAPISPLDTQVNCELEITFCVGGASSPTLANITLDGMELAIHEAVPKRPSRLGYPKVHMVRYADDFVITARHREDLTEHIVPAVEMFLAKRGLRLSPGKTNIVHTSDGFDFLGANIRKYNGKYLAKPTKKGILRVARECEALIKKHRVSTTDVLIRQLNVKLRGWGHQFRHLVSRRAFEYIDNRIFESLKRWMRRRHPNKNTKWLNRKYFRTEGRRHWVFFANYRDASGTLQRVDLMKLGSLGFRRHTQIRSKAHPFDPAYTQYFHQRWLSRRRFARYETSGRG